MATAVQSWETPQSLGVTSVTAENWYALQTRSRHEKVVVQRLAERGVTTFLPMMTEIHRWSDRKKVVEVPLFSSYVFAKVAPTNIDRLRVLRVDGVLSLVGTRGEGTPIPDEQIDAVRMLLERGKPVSAHPYLQIGQRVRIRSGALDGMEGILVSCNGDSSLVISINAIRRSLAVRVEGYAVEAA